MSALVKMTVSALALGCSSAMRKRQKVSVGIEPGDANPIGLSTIEGTFNTLITVFGQQQGNLIGIRVADLRTVVVDRKFPPNYQFVGEFPAQTDNPNGGVAGFQGDNQFVEASLQNVNFIICPFLGTVVNEGALPIRQAYDIEELMTVVRGAGASEQIVSNVFGANFANNPAGAQDIWNMEGAQNEHFDSTGINDCFTNFFNCGGDVGSLACESTSDRSCVHPNGPRFDAIFGLADLNRDGIITTMEVSAAVAALRTL